MGNMGNIFRPISMCILFRFFFFVFVPYGVRHIPHIPQLKIRTKAEVCPCCPRNRCQRSKPHSMFHPANCFAAPQLQPPAIVFGALLDFTNYDLYPPSVRLVNPFTREPYSLKSIPTILRTW